MNGVVLAVPFLFCAGWSIRNKNLDDIASYIQDSPSRALDSLVTMDTLCLTRKSDKAKYALLYSIALDKNYIDTRRDLATQLFPKYDIIGFYSTNNFDLNEDKQIESSNSNVSNSTNKSKFINA